MNLEQGLVSVIMSNYNTPEVYLRDAIESVLNQTYKNFEFIIIDDCSTDDSLDVIKSYDDTRIILIENEENLGITKSLNRGLEVAKGEFVARMDSDDICYPNRFEKQVNYLKNNQDTIVCGTGIKLIGDWKDNHSNEYICRMIPDKESYRVKLLFGNNPNIVHPTAMFNHVLLKKNGIHYDENYRYAQDYRMWVTCSGVGECKNIPETLLEYRVHNHAVSVDKKHLQQKCVLGIINEQLSRLQMEQINDYNDIHIGFLSTRHEYNLKYKDRIYELISKNRQFHIYDQKIFEDILWKKWTQVSYFALRNEKRILRICFILFNIPHKYIKYLIEIKRRRKRLREVC